MGAQLELIKGDMFDGPTDLVVIPCSRVPTVSWFIAERLRSFRIPTPRGRMQLGEVVFAELQQANNIAQVAAYAASVGRGLVSPEVIEMIGRRLGSYSAEHPWLGQIACPLLGTGSGGMEPTDSAYALAQGYLSAAPELARLRLFVLEGAAFAHIRSLLTSEFGYKDPDRKDILVSAHRPPRVFISYTKSTDQHREWVKDIATYLRSVGVDARLDIWHLRPGMDVAQWMCNEIGIADRVLLICDKLYAQKADGRHGGVGWEIRIVQGDLLQTQDTNPDKFIPVVVTENITEGMPAFIKSVYCLHWPSSRLDDSSLKEELVQIIYRVQEEAPPLGRPPAYVIGRS